MREVYIKWMMMYGEDEDVDFEKEMEKKFWSDLQERLDDIKQNPLPYTYQKPELWWQSLRRATVNDFDVSPVTAISKEQVEKLFHAIMTWPEGFKPLKKVEKILQDKIKVFNEQQKLDWAAA